MKTLCITGFAHPALHTIAQNIFNSGLCAPRASQQKENMDMEEWHQRVIAKYEGASPITKIGRLWEQLAADIFLNNLQVPVWGWSSTQSLELLDFWQQFDSQIYFVLVCVSPQQALAHALAHPSSNPDEDVQARPEKVLENWYHTHQTMLRFHLRHPERSVLIMAEDAQAAPAQLIEKMASQWKLPLQAACSADAQFAQPDAVALYLAQRLLESHSAENALHQEVLACITHIGQEALNADEAQPTLSALSSDAVIHAYRQLCDRSQEAQALEQAHAELTATRFTLQQQINELRQAHDEQSQIAVKQVEQLKALEQTHVQLNTEIADAKEENELLLTQLHQVQEELEGTFLKQQQTTQQLTAAKVSLENLAQEKNQLIATRDTLNKQAAELTKARDEQAKIAAERKAQLDALTKDKAALTNARDTLNKQVAELTKAREEQAKIAAERKTQLDTLTKDKGVLQVELTDAREEGDLLLNQLHQVQEELEHYFLENQQTKLTNETLEKRLHRVYLRIPHYSDYSSLKVSVAKDCTAIDWHFEDLEIAGRVFTQLQCRTQFLNGGALIRFIPSPNHPLAFLRSSAKDTTVDIVVGANGIGPMPTLDALGTSDIAFLHSMWHLFEQALQGTASSQVPAGFPTVPLRQALAQLPLQLQALPPRWRFDQVQLKNSHVVPGYEHLWLVVDKLSFGTQQWEQFEFRVACANTEATFGTDPKLEFPQAKGDNPLTGWFVESNDEYGNKLELRFAQPDAMDISVWSQLSASDHDFVRALLSHIPAMLTTLQTANVSIHRDWQDWKKLVQVTQRILDLRAPVDSDPTSSALNNDQPMEHNMQAA